MQDYKDQENDVGLELTKYSLIFFNEKVVSVIGIDKTGISIVDNASITYKIMYDEWDGIFLSKEWVDKLGIEIDKKISRLKVNANWMIRKSGTYHYLTILNSETMVENPIIALHSVHELQHWYYLLTDNYLLIKE
jgi:hypothetical protein